MGASESSKNNVPTAPSVLRKMERERARHWTREEVIKSFEITIETNEEGKEVVKSQLLDLLRANKPTCGVEFSWTSVYDEDPVKETCMAKAMGEQPFVDSREDRAFGALFGMAVGDAMGARVEFSRLDYEASDIKGMGSGRDGKFMLQPGQWTDDTSLGLCVADSLLAWGKFNGHDMMHRFLAWWFCGHNNAFRFEEEPDLHTSCGLGGTIKASFMEYLRKPTLETSAGNKDSSGNGSIMRLAAIPVFFRKDIAMAEQCAARQSLLTHQGIEAAECCILMAHVMVRGICGESLHDVLGSLGTSFQTTCPSVIALAKSEAEKMKPSDDEPKETKSDAPNEGEEAPKEGDVSPKEGESDASKKGEETPKETKSVEPKEGDNSPKQSESTQEDLPIDPDRNWNWKEDDFKYSPERTRWSSGYIGSYAMDALAMSFHILWSTTSFSEALLKAVNLRGDADTVGAIVGQIAGIFYGCSHIPASWKKTVTQWDNHEIAYRAYRLYNHLLFSEDVHSLKV